MIINHNMSADFASRALNSRDSDLGSAIEKLSSGLRINRAGDDASGLAVSEKMRSQIRGLNRASKNVQDGISFIQTTEGYLAETTDVLHRVRELAIQAANGIYSSDDRAQIEVEVVQLVDEINRVALHAQFNGMNMLTGRFATDGPVGKVNFHIGANVDQSISITIGDMTGVALGLIGEGGQDDIISIATAEDANRTLAAVDQALKIVTTQRANLGAVQNRMTYVRQGVDVAAENLQASESRIRDTDMASEMAKFVKSRVLSQSSTAMLAQANAQSNLVLSLLNG